MTNQQMQYAYWQRTRQQLLHALYKHYVAGANCKFDPPVPPEPTYVTIHFLATEGIDKYLCNGEEVNMKSGAKVLKGSTAIIEAVIQDTYKFIKWSDEPERAKHDNPRTIDNITADMTLKAELEKIATQISLNKITDKFPADYYWSLYESDTLEGTYTPVDKDGRTQFTYGEGVHVKTGKCIKLKFVGRDDNVKISKIERPDTWPVADRGYSDGYRKFEDVEGYKTVDTTPISINMYFTKI